MNSCLYQGVLRHRRLQPRRTISSTAFMAWLDLDELDGCLRRHPPQPLCRRRLLRRRLSAGRAAEGEGAERLESLTGCARGARDAPDPAALFRLPFNPVNFYYCYDEADTRWVLAEVRNTPWNERHYAGGRPAGAPAGKSLSRFAV
jgi:DUF1365 family protein